MEEKDGHNSNLLGNEEEKNRFLREIFSEEQQFNRTREEQKLHQQSRATRGERTQQKQIRQRQTKQTHYNNRTQAVRMPERQYKEEGRKNLERKRKQKKKQRRKKILSTLLLFFICIGLCLGAFQFFRSLMMPSNPGVATDVGEDVAVTIPEGASTSDIAEILKEKNLIKSVFRFKLESKLNNYDGTFQKGNYTLNTSMTHQQIMELLQKGGEAEETYQLVIPEGFTIDKIAQRLQEQDIMTAEEFINEVNTGEFDYEFLKDLPTSPDRRYKLEGYLFPATYTLYDGVTAHQLIDKMLQRFEIEYTQSIKDNLEQSEHTLDEIVTIASIVEAEIQVPEERARAAGVIRNRLEQGMKLQIDATVLYAQGTTKDRVMESDLEYSSPYNTYQVEGLPIGPISNPGSAALEAALHPEDNNYIYYVVEKYGSSNHVFTETYEDFIKARDNYFASRE
ncbi:endolytic transglycosylase MltG [Clostridium sp. MD294]|uniref:endolytic transglycosylase MltG n=1 Tax=Clostridium sp. MD294 TaxID=97138 RepID=UPI0002CA7969|nr:endolytic transglycosylase MltG [Clostridium sp. MD294]NDO45619.1 endolytic transglycosylase MltG [Clostridium sp. MD294]USF30726.1 Endolytic murein transglycosylase [Clostridium sp. MD294]